ncbi:unnamed protein product [Brassica napus]|uniref:(rape) hypothetical protein n=1 Tax=Brassica napus TaxID=3708 RepID=A0A816JR27_BRANA|nr:unnamed protein product [Brassica napus]
MCLKPKRKPCDPEMDSCLAAFLGQVSTLSIHPYGSHVIPQASLILRKLNRRIWSVFQMSISLSSLPRRYMESVCILPRTNME